MNNKAIGIFDSGLGGLTCVSALAGGLPEENLIYFGDTARTPYGDKSDETISRFASQVADFLVAQDVKLLLIACNTISALCGASLRERYPGVRVVDIISPTASYLVENASNIDNVGLIATRATVRSGLYERALKDRGFNKLRVSIPCPLFVPLVEEGIVEGPIVEEAIKYYLDGPIAVHDLDTLILGCTHYPFIEETIHKLYPGLSVVNPSQIILTEVSRILDRDDLRADSKQAGARVFWASDLSETYRNMIDRITVSSEGHSRVFKEKRWSHQ